MTDPGELDRFVQAQENTYAQALAEIRAGRKRTHWMWYIFPQIAGLGSSPMAQRFAIQGLEEARAYLAHPLLGPRLEECAAAVVAIQDRSARDIFDSPDDLKLRSSATLFASLLPPGSIFHRLLDQYYGGEPDGRTLQLLNLADRQTADPIPPWRPATP
jgi:uncharacterized protein (DUF1810 family)